MQFFLDTLALLLMLSGLVATLLNLPGCLLVFAGILFSAWQGSFVEIGPWWLSAFALITLLALFLDNLTMMLGAKRFGASKWGIIGAFIGGITCTILLGPLGILLGPLLGALLFELVVAKKAIKAAFHAGIGSLIGTLLGIIGKLALSAMMVVGWLIIEIRSYF